MGVILDLCEDLERLGKSQTLHLIEIYLWVHICQKVWTKASGGERTTTTQRINSVYNVVADVILPFGVSLDLYPSCSTVAKEIGRGMAKLKAV